MKVILQETAKVHLNVLNSLVFQSLGFYTLGKRLSIPLIQNFFGFQQTNQMYLRLKEKCQISLLLLFNIKEVEQ